MSRHVRHLALSAVIAAAMIIGSCGSPVDLFQELSNEVKLAKNLYLVIASVEPAISAGQVSPDAVVKLVFDRTVDMATVNAATLVITPDTGENGLPLDISYDYNDATHTLTVNHGAYFGLQTQYAIKATAGLKGMDGEVLQSEMTWTFTTGVMPVGSVSINGGDDYVNNNNNVTLTISYNDITDRMKIATTEAGLATATLVTATTPYTFPLEPGEGEKSVYIQFTDENTNPITYSVVRSDSIIRDTVTPVVSTGIDFYLTNAAQSKSIDATVSDANSAAGLTFAWTRDSGPGTVTFGAPGAEDTTVSADADGVYVLKLTVTDPAGNTAADTVAVTRDIALPTVNAGADFFLSLGVPSVALNAATSDAVTWLWTKTSGSGTVTFGTADAEDTTVSVSADGSYLLTLTVTDVAGNVASDSVAVIRDTIAPSVNAGTDFYLNLANPTVIANASSSDAGSGVAGHQWTQTSGGGTVTFDTPTAEDTTVSASADDSYVLTLTVTDAAGNSADDSVTVTRDIVLPSVNAGADFFLTIADPATTINAATSDTGTGIASLLWSKASGSGTVTFGTAGLEDTTVSASTDGSYVLTLTVTDVAGNSASDSVAMVRDLVAPSVNAGADFYLNIASPTSTINASTSDAGSGIASRLWTKSSGSGTPGFGAPSAEDTTVNPSADDVYVLTLTVTDAAGNTADDTVTVTRDTVAPGVNAGADFYLNIVASAKTIDATTSDGGTGIASRLWSQTSGAGTVVFETPNADDTVVSATVDGVYVVQLVVTDAAGNSTTDTVAVTRDILAPSVDAGLVKYVSESILSIALTATASDTTSGIAARSWTLTSVPTGGTLTFSNAAVEDPTVSSVTVDGSYTCTLTVTDNAGNSAADYTYVRRDTKVPTSSAGADQYLSASVTSKAMAGVTSDPAYSAGYTRLWTYTGPGTLSISNTGSATPTVSAASANGTYVLTLTATDYAGHSASDTANVIVDTVAPTVDAGLTKYLSASVTSVALAATASDASPSSGYTRGWSYSGPGILTFNNGTLEDPTVSAATVEGTYTLTLTVTDTAGNAASDTVSLVNDLTLPSVEAGTTKYLNPSVTSVALVAGAYDELSGLSSYLWTYTGPGTLTFSSTTTEDPTVSAATVEGTYTLTLKVYDKAGNSATDAVWVENDLTPPSPPTITATSPTTDTTPTWSWTAGTGGTNYYQRQLDSTTGTWTTTTTTSYTPTTALTYGPHTLYVKGRDLAGNWSTTYSSKTIYVSPHGFTPMWGQTGVATTTNITWAAYTGATGYRLYYRVAGGAWDNFSVSTISYDPPIDLLAGKTYEWYVVALGLKGTTLYTSPTLWFRT